MHERLKYYYTYIDITLDGLPFYVGKGNIGRVALIERNDVWDRIVAKHGYKGRIVVFETLVEQWSFDREVELIATLKTNCKRKSEGHWGANKTDGGEGCSGYKHTAETRKFLSDFQRGEKNHTWGTKHSVEQCLKTSENLRGEKNGFFKRTHSEMTRQLISIACTINGNYQRKQFVPIDERTKRSVSMTKHFANPAQREQSRMSISWKARRVEQSTMDDVIVTVFPSFTEAERQTHIGHIKDCCKGSRRYAGGFKWRYLDPPGHIPVDASHPDAQPRRCEQCNLDFAIKLPVTPSRIKTHLKQRFCSHGCATAHSNVNRTGFHHSEDAKRRISAKMKAFMCSNR